MERRFLERKFSLLVVDDEPIARAHVLQSLDWDELNITQLYEADNGAVGLAMAKEHRPDIMLLDVRMPQMSGVELMEQLIKLDQDIQVIVLSAYGDFEVARKMVSMGKVTDYLLKPVEEDVLTEAIVKCQENIEERCKQRGLRENYKEMQQYLVRQDLREVVFGREKSADMDYLPSDLQALQIGICYKEDGALFFQRKCVPTELAPLKYCFKTRNPKFHVLCFETGDSQAIEQVCQSMVAQGYYIGLGRVYGECQDVNMSYQEAMLACELSLFGQCASVRRIEELYQYEEDYPDWDSAVDSLKKAMVSGNVAAIEELLSKVHRSVLHGLTAAVNPQRVSNLAVLKAHMARLLEAVLDENREHLNLINMYTAMDSYAVYDSCRNILLQKRDERETSPGHKDLVMQRVKDYICTHYSEHITLNSVAATVYINPSYLSRLFSETEGCVFTDYVMALRLEKAKELLTRNLGMKIYEVAEAVGYNSPKYFIKVFKDAVGETPAAYRSRHYFDRKL